MENQNITFISSFSHHEKIPYLDRTITLMVVSGTHYEMGKMIGQVMGKELYEDLLSAPKSLIRKVGVSLNRKRHFASDLELGLIELTPYIPKEILEEIDGVYAGCQEAGFTIQDRFAILKTIIVTELSERECSMFALKQKNGLTFQLRNLDYYTKIKMGYHPTVIIKIPQTKHRQLMGIPYAYFDFVGYMTCGAFTGINEKGVVLSQIRGNFREKTNSLGMPISSLIQQVLSRAGHAQHACSILREIQSPSDLYIIVSDPSTTSSDDMQLLINGPHLFEKIANAYNCNLSSFNLASEKYQHLDNCVYWTDGITKYRDGKEIQFNNHNLYYLLKKYQHDFTPEHGMVIAKEASNDSTIVSALFCNTTKEVWISFAGYKSATHQNPYIYIDLKKYFSLKNKHIVRTELNATQSNDEVQKIGSLSS